MQNTGKKQFKLVVTEPKSFDECPKLVDNLKSEKPVIINLEKLENETARKILIFSAEPLMRWTAMFRRWRIIFSYLRRKMWT